MSKHKLFQDIDSRIVRPQLNTNYTEFISMARKMEGSGGNDVTSMTHVLQQIYFTPLYMMNTDLLRGATTSLEESVATLEYMNQLSDNFKTQLFSGLYLSKHTLEYFAKVIQDKLTRKQLDRYDSTLFPRRISAYKQLINRANTQTISMLEGTIFLMRSDIDEDFIRFLFRWGIDFREALKDER